MPAAKMKPPADFVLRPGDQNLTVDQLKSIPLFKDIKLDMVEGQAGIVILRRFRAGETVCRQNEPGYTAFYILTAADVGHLGLGPAAAEAGASPDEAAPVARVVREELRRTTGLLGRVRRFLGGAGEPAPSAPVVPVLREGELFGEASCLYRTPRSATVVVRRDCYMLELLRNVLDKMYANKAFKEHLDAVYRRRVLELHLRALPLFRDLPDKLFETLRERVDLLEFAPGDLICDENERADALYVLRSGFVKVVKQASALLGEDAVPDLRAFCAKLRDGGREPAGPRRKLWDLLPEAVRAAAGRAAGEDPAGRDEAGGPAPADRRDVLLGLNELVKQPKLYAQADFKAAGETAALEPEAKKLPAAPKKWTQHQQVREFNRRLLAALFPGLVLPPGSAGPARILSYRSTEGPAGTAVFGEIGVLLDEPRTATCVAYDHAGEGKLINGRVELVAISRELFEVVRPAVEDSVRRLAEDRQRNTREMKSLPLWHEAQPAALSRQFDDLGLIQGQKLMLIDLERCTRCDKCVEACVATHSGPWWAGLLPAAWRPRGGDGRSRLFLDGPRLEVFDGTRPRTYLVPATCRQCRDPVCLIGCPVGSIHKGDNGQIVIEDWCIGCSRCAEQCPYGSIQMHAVGIIPRGADGWLHRRGEGPWAPGRAPFGTDREFRARYPEGGPVDFRRPFRLEAQAAAQGKSFRLTLRTAAAQPAVRVNGVAVPVTAARGTAPGKVEWNYEALLALETGGPAPDGEPQPVLRVGDNVLDVAVEPPAGEAEVVLDAGLYAFTKPVVAPGLAEGLNQETVASTAVVCDMCSDQLGRQPACVTACPHEAAMRINVRSDAFAPWKG